MKKPVWNQFLDFRCRHNLSVADIKELAEEYANSGPDKSRSYFVKKYQISEHVFYRARDFAVICMLVDKKTEERIFAKAAFNCKQNNSKKSSVGSHLHAEKLYSQKEEFFNSFTESEIRDILFKYAEGLELSKIAAAYDTGVRCIKMLLKKGIILGYYEEPTYSAIALRLKLKGRSIDEIFRRPR